MTTTAERVIKIIREHYEATAGDAPEKPVTAETVLTDDLKFDSLDHVEVLMALEEEFDLEIPDADAENWTKVDHFIVGIEQKLA